ncbi:MAG: hypothetical protein ACJ8ER_09375 [Allosphingosinicella sp.]
MVKLFLRAAPALLLLSSCAASLETRPFYATCHVLGSSGWAARMEIVPANRSKKPTMLRKLVVTGRVTLAGEGLAVSLERGPLARLDEPIQQVFVRTDGTPDPAAAPVTRTVQGVFAGRKHYGGVEIRCGDGIIGEIREVAPAPAR